MTGKEPTSIATIQAAMQPAAEECAFLASSAAHAELTQAVSGFVFDALEALQKHAEAIVQLGDVGMTAAWPTENHELLSGMTAFAPLQPLVHLLRFATSVVDGVGSDLLGDHPGEVLSHLVGVPGDLPAVFHARQLGDDLGHVVAELKRLDDTGRGNLADILRGRHEVAEQQRRDQIDAETAANLERLRTDPDFAAQYLDRSKPHLEAVTDDDTGDDSPDGPGAA